jgi:hypothetical protein
MAAGGTRVLGMLAVWRPGQSCETYSDRRGGVRSCHGDERDGARI